MIFCFKEPKSLIRIKRNRILTVRVLNLIILLMGDIQGIVIIRHIKQNLVSERLNRD